MNEPQDEQPLLDDMAKVRRLESLSGLLEVVDRLRDPGGCPWDREQTVASMTPHVVEEAHELAEAVESGDDEAIVAELGDVLMVLAMIGRIAQEEGRFGLGHCAVAIHEKLVRRHPHVFGEVEAADSASVLTNWERIKKEEREAKGEDHSALAGVPRTLPALQRAARLSAKALAAGFRWPSASGALDKLREEIEELTAAMGVSPGAGGPRELRGTESGNDEEHEALDREHIEDELGDVLMAAAFLGTYLDIDPERACKRALERFERRYRHMEGQLGGSVSGCDLETMMSAWRQAKREA